MSLQSLSTAFSEYCTRLVQLHAFIQHDDDECEQAEKLREEMDGFWRLMTREEVAFADELSSDIYFIHEAPNGPHTINDEDTAKIVPGMRAGTPIGMIEEVRRHRHRLSPALFASIQAICWRQLGLPQIAEPFFEAVKRRNPEMAEIAEFAARNPPFVHSFVAQV